MRDPKLLTAGFLLLAMAGCKSSVPAKQEHGVRQMWVSDWIRNASIEEAIITQRTIHAYHFAKGSSELNDLGEQAVDVLAEHYAENAGELSVRQGDASDELYGARVESVMARLEAAGVDLERMSITDSPPRGDGMSSERLLIILAEEPSFDGSSSVVGGNDFTNTGVR